ncbi:MAG: NADH-quinone oxidoreductase subunit NuoN [Bauldia sp.]|nr:NADH-quinone oxidoreductase subunit NuoN [Bauldia sp.]
MNPIAAPTGDELLSILPELLLAGGALVLLLVGVFARNSARAVMVLSMLLVAVAAGALFLIPVGDEPMFYGAVILDPFARFMKIATLIGSLFALVLSSGSRRKEVTDRFEYPILVILATLGMMVMISSHDIIALYVGLELQSLSLYVLAAVNRDSVRSTEAGIKYFVLGALSSGLLLYGGSLVYGFTGQTSFDGIAAALVGGEPEIGLIFGLVFILAGLAFKVAAVPFHMWTPDVYQGAPTPVTAFFAAAPKLAAMALLIRVVSEPFAAVTDQWQQVLVFLAIASMVLGAFAAIGQNNIKRLMAYSAIGHVGYALVGLSAGTEEGVRGVMIYLVVYLAMTLGTFACILSMRRAEGPVETIADLAGLSRTNPMMAFFLAALMFSLAGIPPLAGFFAKFYVFSAAVEAGLYVLAVIGVVASVVGAFYYLRIVKIMYFDEPVAAFEPMGGQLRGVLILSGLFTLAFIVFAGPLNELASTAAGTFF